MNCPNCQARFSLWKSFKLSNMFRVECSACSDEIVKDTAGLTGYRSSMLAVILCAFLTVIFFGRISFWGFVFLLPAQLYFDNFYASLRSLGSTKLSQPRL